MVNNSRSLKMQVARRFRQRPCIDLAVLRSCFVPEYQNQCFIRKLRSLPVFFVYGPFMATAKAKNIQKGSNNKETFANC